MNVEEFIEKDRQLLENTENSRLRGKLGDLLGYGSYGFVLEYNDGSSDKKVIKIFDTDYLALSCKGEALEKTAVLRRGGDSAQSEIETTRGAAFTKSPNLMKLLDSPKPIVVGGKRLSFMVMPYMQTVAEWAIEGDRREAQIVEILCDCCSGLQILHAEPEIVGARENGMPALVHYDIKPDNIFVSPGEPHQFLLGDYSIAQRIIDLKEDPKEGPSSANPYMAPGPCGPSSDVYSLGWVLYWWMKGQEHPTEAEVRARKENTLKMPESWGDNEELWNVFLGMTEKNPADRYQSAAETKKALYESLDAREKRLEERRIIQQKKKELTNSLKMIVRFGSWYGQWYIEDKSDTLYIEGEGDMPPRSEFAPESWDGLWWIMKNQVKRVVVSDGITSISGVLRDFDNLNEVVLPGSCKYLDEYAFEGCKRLKHIVLPEGLKHISAFAFSGCESLTRITVPEGVMGIGRQAFAFCSELIEIEFPQSLHFIGEFAFWNCKSLMEVTLPQSLLIMESNIFWECEKLHQVTMPQHFWNEKKKFEDYHGISMNIVHFQ